MKTIYLGFSGFSRNLFYYNKLSELPLKEYSITIDPRCCISNDVKIEKGVKIGQDVIVGRGVILCENSKIEHGVTIGPYTYIGSNSNISKNISIPSCVRINKNALIKKDNWIAFDEHWGNTVAHLTSDGTPFISLDDMGYSVENWMLRIYENKFWTTKFKGNDENSFARLDAFISAKNFIESIVENHERQ